MNKNMQIPIFFDNLLKNDHSNNWFELIGTCYKLEKVFLSFSEFSGDLGVNKWGKWGVKYHFFAFFDKKRLSKSRIVQRMENNCSLRLNRIPKIYLWRFQ